MIHFISHFVHWFNHHRNILNPLMAGSHKFGFIAQLARALHQDHDVMGSNPVEVLNFSGFCMQLLKLRS